MIVLIFVVLHAIHLVLIWDGFNENVNSLVLLHAHSLLFSWKVWPNTLKCHQLIAYLTNPNRNAENKPSTSECNAAIFDAMYECGENVSLTDTLVKIATSRLGVSESEAIQLRSHLESNAGSKEVMREIQEGRKRYKISGVPYFIVGASEGGNYVGKPYVFSGAQDADTFKEMFDELASVLE